MDDCRLGDTVTFILARRKTLVVSPRGQFFTPQQHPGTPAASFLAWLTRRSAMSCGAREVVGTTSRATRHVLHEAPGEYCRHSRAEFKVGAQLETSLVHCSLIATKSGIHQPIRRATRSVKGDYGTLR